MAGYQPFSFDPFWPLSAVNPDGSVPDIRYCEPFQCYSVNGVLAPNPLSYALPVDTRSAPMDTRTEDEITPEPVAREHPTTGSSISESSRKRLRQTEGDHPMHFTLYKFVDRIEEYHLKVHEPTCDTTRYHNLKVYEDKSKWVMRVVTTTAGNHAVNPWLEDPSPPLFQKRSDLNLQQRLVGWTLESRARKSDGREDKFYYHQGKQYKSFVQVLTFILYANKDLKDLRLTATNAVIPHVEGGAVQPQHENAGAGGAAGDSQNLDN